MRPCPQEMPGSLSSASSGHQPPHCLLPPAPCHQTSPCTSQPRARPGLNEEAYVRGTSEPRWRHSPPGTGFFPLASVSSRFSRVACTVQKSVFSSRGGMGGENAFGRTQQLIGVHAPFLFPGQFGCLTKVFMLGKPGADDQGTALISARGLTPFQFFLVRVGGTVQ